MGIRRLIPTIPVKNVELSIALSELRHVVNPALKDCARRVDVPATSTSLGEIGEFALSSTYVYFCVAKNTWKRIALSSW